MAPEDSKERRDNKGKKISRWPRLKGCHWRRLMNWRPSRPNNSQRRLYLEGCRMVYSHIILAAQLREQGRLVEASSVYREASRGLVWLLCVETMGRNHSLGKLVRLLSSELLLLAKSCESADFLMEAESLLKTAIHIHRRASDRHLDRRQLVLSLRGLACFYTRNWRFSDAESPLLEIVSLTRSLHDTGQGEALSDIQMLGTVYMLQGKNALAEPICREGLSKSLQINGSDSAITAEWMENLSAVLASQGEHRIAEQLCRDALATKKRAIGCQNLDLVNSLRTLASLLIQQDRFEEAERLCQEAIAISKKSSTQLRSIESNPIPSDEQDPLMPELLEMMLDIHLGRGDYSASLESLEAYHLNMVRHLGRELPGLPVSYRHSLLLHYRGCSRATFRLAMAYKRAIPHAIKSRLYRHGLLQELERQQKSLGRRIASERADAKYYLKELMTFPKGYASPLNNKQTRRRIGEKINELELSLYSRLLGVELDNCRPEDVAAVLPVDAVLIEFEHVKSMDCYFAMILRPDKSVALVELECATDIEELVDGALNASRNGFADALNKWVKVSQRLIRPLLVEMRGFRQWFVCPDGALHRVPFTVLPWLESNTQWLTDRIVITLITSGRDLLHLNQDAPQVSSPVVLANPLFDSRPASGSAFVDVTLPIPSERSRDMGSLQSWPPLPNTANEGVALAKLMDARLLLQAEATTRSLMDLHQPKVLHIATHGYFLPDQQLPESDAPEVMRDGTDPLVGFQGEDPMLRSGLVLAGADHPDADPLDDGYLTALEATHLNLQGTELVTLSACDTGRGDVKTGEGVYGLQRALIVAGARSMLLSLWKVSDDATCEFMVRFYTLLKQGVSRYDALVTVQREFREHSNVLWRHPYYWGAWQLIGDWRPIEGL